MDAKKRMETLRQLVLLFPAYTDMCWFKYYEPKMYGKKFKISYIKLRIA